MTGPTVDEFLRDPQIVNAKLQAMAEEKGLAGFVLPPPIERRIHRRDGWALWRYRGVHRHGCWTVDALTEAVIASKSADRAAHRRSLRRPVEPIVWLGSYRTNLRFYGVPPSPEDVGTVVIAPAEDAEVVSLPAVLQGPPAEPFAWDAADTGPILLPDEQTLERL